MRVSLVTFSAVLLLASSVNGQVSKFGQEWPSLRECLEYSDETGLWVQLGPEQSYKNPRKIYFRFNKDGTFSATWNELTKKTNKFGRDKSIMQEFVRIGRWNLEHRRVTFDEYKTMSAEERPVGPPYAAKIHFLTLTFVGNKETVRTEYEKDSKSINGTVTLALYEFQIKEGPRKSGVRRWVVDRNIRQGELSELTELRWLVLKMSPEIDCVFLRREYLPGNREFWFVEWYHN